MVYLQNLFEKRYTLNFNLNNESISSSYDSLTTVLSHDRTHDHSVKSLLANLINFKVLRTDIKLIDAVARSLELFYLNRD